MDVADLSSSEVLALVILAKHLVHADGEVSSSEVMDLMNLGAAVGTQRFAVALAQTKDRYKRRDDAMGMADVVRRPESQHLVYALLEELAKGDGLDTAEEDILAELRIRWGL